MPVLGNVKIPSDKAVVEKMFRFSEKPQLAKQFADFMLDMLLLPYGYESKAILSLYICIELISYMLILEMAFTSDQLFLHLRNLVIMLQICPLDYVNML